MRKLRLIEKFGRFTARKNLFAAIVIVIVSASVVANGSTVIHNIDLEEAWEKARNYARKKRSDPGRTYKHYSTDCANAYSGHNHVVRCTISYQNAQDTARGRKTCTERVEFYLQLHGKVIGPIESIGRNYNIYFRHTSSRQC